VDDAKDKKENDEREQTRLEESADKNASSLSRAA
jgi:hypothetical protein